jgi:tRNA(adenine34) deaminase
MIANNKIDFMDRALKEARKAYKYKEVPIGAVVVDPQGVVIGVGYNQTERKNSQIEHAEIIAIRRACKKMGDWRLNGCAIYVTLEPCLMCFGLIQLSRLHSVTYGAPSTLYGVGLSGAVENIPPYARDIIIEGGVQQEECLNLLRLFFEQARRKKRKESCETEKRNAE